LLSCLSPKLSHHRPAGKSLSITPMMPTAIRCAKPGKVVPVKEFSRKLMDS
jgi:hypothetical protein